MFNSSEFESFETQTAQGGDTVPTTQELLIQTKQDANKAKSNMQLLVIVVIMLLIMVYSALSEQNGNTDTRQVNLGFTAADTLEEFIEANNGYTFEFDFERIFAEYQQIQFDNTYSSLSRFFISEFNRIFFGAQLDGSFLNTSDLKLLSKCSDTYTPLRNRIQASIQKLAEELTSIKLLQADVIQSKLELAKKYLSYRQNDLAVLQNNKNRTKGEEEKQDIQNKEAEEQQLEAGVLLVDNEIISDDRLEIKGEPFEDQSEQLTENTENSKNQEIQIEFVQQDIPANRSKNISAEFKQGKEGEDTFSNTSDTLVDCLSEEENLHDLSAIEKIVTYIRFSKEKLSQITGENFAWLDDEFLLREIAFIDQNLTELDDKMNSSWERLHKQYQSKLITKFNSSDSISKEPCRGITKYEKFIYEDFDLRQELLDLRVQLNGKIWKSKETVGKLKEKYEEEVNSQLSLLVDSYFKCIRLD